MSVCLKDCFFFLGHFNAGWYESRGTVGLQVGFEDEDVVVSEVDLK